MEKKTKYWLFMIFTITVLLRLILAFATPNLTYDSYFHLRQVEQIHNTGLPLYNDPLSYGGRELRFLPLFHYFMAPFSFIIPSELLAKIIPNILIALLVIIVFFISRKITENDTASLLSAGITGFLPILYNTNSFNVETLFLPLVFFAIYSFINLQEKRYVYLYLFSFLLLCFTSSATILLLIGWGIYFLLSFLENKKIDRAEKELVIFSALFYSWSQLLFFKKTLLEQGINFIWQNVPSSLLLDYFPSISLSEALILVSFIPFLAGIIVVYRSLFQIKNEKSFLLISLVISTTLLALFKLIPFKQSLTFTAIILAILFALFYQEISEYFSKTKFSRYKMYYLVLIILILGATMIFPAVQYSLKQETPSSEEIEAFRWIKFNTPPNAGVMALLEEGHLITYYSQRRNLMDEQFRLISDVNSRFANLNTLFNTPFQTNALDLLSKYKLQYLVFSAKAKEKYHLNALKYQSEDCFLKVYKKETSIFQVKCKLEKE